LENQLYKIYTDHRTKWFRPQLGLIKNHIYTVLGHFSLVLKSFYFPLKLTSFKNSKPEH